MLTTMATIDLNRRSIVHYGGCVCAGARPPMLLLCTGCLLSVFVLLCNRFTNFFEKQVLASLTVKILEVLEYSREIHIFAEPRNQDIEKSNTLIRE